MLIELGSAARRSPSRRTLAAVFAAAAITSACAGPAIVAAEPAPAQSVEPDASTPPSPDAASEAARTYFPDAILIDQNGKPLRFHTDLLEGKVVVIGAVGAGCKDHCELGFATWAEVAKKLGKRLGTDVHFISLASDPMRDTEERMRGLAKRAKAGKGWYFLTGPPASLRLVLAKLDLVPTEEDGAHAHRWVIANVKSGLYKLGPDTMGAEQLLDTVEECLADR